MTTNFDDLLEKAMNEHQQTFFGSSYTVIKKDKELPYAVNDEYLIKMHGDWEEMNFVFKEDDYLNYAQNFPLIESFVKGIFSSHSVLFIGFSFSDSNLKQIVNWVKRILGEDFQRAYLFQHDNEIAPHQEKYFRKKGILPIAYDSSITKLLAEIEPKKEVVISSEPGRRTYNFLRLLELFNYRDYERLKKARTQHVLDQMYESLKQFDAFNSIPPSTLENLFPFSPTRLQLAKVKDYHREPTDARHETGNHLQTSNEKIIALMQGIEFKEGRILLKENSPEAEAIKRIPHFEKKLAYVFDKLRSSQINCIQRIDDNSKDNHNRINYVTNFSKELPFVQWLDFHYKPLLEAVHSRRLMAMGSSVRPLRERLLDGLVLSRLHYYLEAYEVYSDIGKEALKNQDFVTFFICQHNKIFVGRMVERSADYRNHPQDLVERVEDEINTIDLAAYLRVMHLEKEVKGLLTGVFRKDFFEEYSERTKESHKRF
ncbi:MAG: SIR2 family protein [Saprospiraceae bacterium]|nr:SIR2 family protein [Saprospiraceae bacterium]